MGEAPEKYALRHNVRVDIVTAISQDLSSFRESFVQCGFIAARAADNIMSIGGIPNMEKASRLFQSLEGQLDTSRNPVTVLESFLNLLTAEEATRNLAKRIVENYGMHMCTCIHVRKHVCIMYMYMWMCVRV